MIPVTVNKEITPTVPHLGQTSHLRALAGAEIAGWRVLR